MKMYSTSPVSFICLIILSLNISAQTWNYVEVGQLDDWSPIVQIDENGYVHFGNQDVLSTTHAQEPGNIGTGTLTHFPKTVPSGNDEYFPALAVRNLQPHLVYRTYTSNFKVQYWNPDMDAPETYMQAGYHGHYPAVQVSSDDVVHIFYQMDHNSEYGNILYENTATDQQQRVMPDGFDGAATLYSYATAIGPDDELHWIGSLYGYDDGHGKNLYYNKTNNGEFDQLPELMGGADGYFPSITVDSNKVVHAVWEINDIFYARRDTGGWSDPVMISETPTSSEYYYVFGDMGNPPYNAIKPSPENPNTAWVVGEYGIYRTDDSWDHPNIQYIHNSSVINGLFPFSSEVVYCVGDTGRFWYTSNGGVDEGWTEDTTHVSQNLRDCWFHTATAGYAIGDTGTIIYTDNGGNSWSDIISGTTENLYSIGFANADTGYIAAGTGRVLRTFNGGSTWTVLNLGTTNNFFDVYVLSSDTVWIAGENSDVRVSYDAGASWNIRNSAVSSYIPNVYGVYFVSHNLGYLVGSLNADNGFYFCKTTDGGNSWIGTRSTNGNGPGLSQMTDIYALSEDTLFSSGPEGHVFFGTMQSNSRYHKPGIKIDQNGYAHVAYTTATTPSDAVYYVNNIGGTWNTPQAIMGGMYMEQIDGNSRMGLDFNTNTIYIGARSAGGTGYLVYTDDINLCAPINKDITSTIAASATLTEPTELSLSAIDSTSALAVFDFTINDVANDGLPTYIKQIDIWKGPNATDTVYFSNYLKGATLSWESTTVSQVEITNSKVQFGDGNTIFASVPEGGSVTFTLKIWLNSLGNIVDGNNIEFKVSGAHDIIVDTSGSQMEPVASDITSGAISVVLEPAKFIFTDFPVGILPNSTYTFAENFYVSIANEYNMICRNSSCSNLSLTVTALDSSSAITGTYNVTPSGLQSTVSGSVEYDHITISDGAQQVLIRAEGTVNSGTIIAYSDTINILPVYDQVVLANDANVNNPDIYSSLKTLGYQADLLNASGNYTTALPADILTNYSMVWIDEKDMNRQDSVEIKNYLAQAGSGNRLGLALFGGTQYGILAYMHRYGGLGSNFGTGQHQLYPEYKYAENGDLIHGVNNNLISNGLQVSCNGSNIPNNFMVQMCPEIDSTSVQVVFETSMTTGGYPAPVALSHVGTNYRTFRTGFLLDEYGDKEDRDTLINRLVQWFDSPYADTLGHTPYFTNQLNMAYWDVAYIDEDTFFEHTATCDDVDDDITNIVPEVLPSWLSYSYSPGAKSIYISGTPSMYNAGDTTVILKVYDSKGNFMPQEWYMNVVHPNSNPVIVAPTTDNAYVGQAYTLQIEVIDADTIIGDTLSDFQAFPDKSWVQMDENGLLSGTPTIDDIGTTNVFIQAMDAQFGMGTHNVAITVSDISGPFITINSEAINLELETDQDSTITITLSNTGDSDLNWSTTETSTWIDVSITSGTIISGNSFDLSITVDAIGLSPGVYSDTITLSSNASNRSSIDISVEIDIPEDEVPILSVSTNSINETINEGENYLDSIYVNNDGLALLEWSADKSEAWIELSSLFNDVPGGNSTTLYYTILGSGLLEGDYTDTILITSNDVSIKIPVDIQVNAVVDPPEISVSENLLNYTLTEGDNDNDVIQISNIGGGSLTWSASNEDDWLTITPVFNPVTGGSSENLNLSIETTGLDVNNYYDTITIISNDEDIRIPVELVVTSAGTTPQISVSDDSIHFQVISGNSVNDTIQITNTGTGTLTWTASKQATWLELNSTYVSLASGISDYLYISINAASLNSGSYSDTITIESNDLSSSSLKIPVSGSVSVELLANTPWEEGIIIYPNPANAELFVKHHYNHNFNLYIINMEGRVVHSEKIHNSNNQLIHRVNTQKLHTGIYLLHMVGDNFNSMVRISIRE